MYSFAHSERSLSRDCCAEHSLQFGFCLLTDIVALTRQANGLNDAREWLNDYSTGSTAPKRTPGHPPDANERRRLKQWAAATCTYLIRDLHIERDRAAKAVAKILEQGDLGLDDLNRPFTYKTVLNWKKTMSPRKSEFEHTWYREHLADLKNLGRAMTGTRDLERAALDLLRTFVMSAAARE